MSAEEAARRIVEQGEALPASNVLRQSPLYEIARAYLAALKVVEAAAEEVGRAIAVDMPNDEIARAAILAFLRECNGGKRGVRLLDRVQLIRELEAK